jgi:hypothetical protein
MTETMVVGAPMAATDPRGNHDQIEQLKFELVLPANAGSFAEAVASFLDDPCAFYRSVSASVCPS